MTLLSKGPTLQIPTQKVNVRKLTNTQLVKICAQEPGNRDAWTEFCHRFDRQIWLITFRECKNKIDRHSRNQFDQIVQDLVQDVYCRLVENNCKALRNYVGQSENAIYVYLSRIAQNVVNNYVIKMSAQKRPKIDRSLTELVENHGDKHMHLSSQTVIDEPDEELQAEELIEEIENILDDCLTGPDKYRNKLIFKLFFFDGFSANDIAKNFGFRLSPKRVGNILSDLKRIIRRELPQRHR